MASLRQIRANVENARKSTGPTTPEGKAASRRNALKHGLAGALLVLPEDDAEAATRRALQLIAALKPANSWEMWLTERIGLLMVRIERCECQDAFLRQLQADRVGTRWDDDRRLAAEELGAALPRSPALTARRLRATRQGCDWLIERWQGLARRLAEGPWDDPARRHALDLLGVAAECRAGATAIDPAPGRDPAEVQRALAADQMARLRALKAEALDEADRDEQLAAELGQEPEPDRARRLLRRYQQAAVRELAWCRSQFRSQPRQSRPERPEPNRSAASPPPEPPRPVPAPSPAAVPSRGDVAARAVPGPPALREVAAWDDIPAVVPVLNRKARRAAAAAARQRRSA